MIRLYLALLFVITLIAPALAMSGHPKDGVSGRQWTGGTDRGTAEAYMENDKGAQLIVNCNDGGDQTANLMYSTPAPDQELTNVPALITMDKNTTVNLVFQTCSGNYCIYAPHNADDFTWFEKFVGQLADHHTISIRMSDLNDTQVFHGEGGHAVLDTVLQGCKDHYAD